MNKLLLILWNIIVMLVGVLYLYDPNQIDINVVRLIGIILIIDGALDIYKTLKK